MGSFLLHAVVVFLKISLSLSFSLFISLGLTQKQRRFSGDKPENRLAAKVPLLRWVPSSVAASAAQLSSSNSRRSQSFTRSYTESRCSSHVLMENFMKFVQRVAIARPALSNSLQAPLLLLALRLPGLIALLRHHRQQSAGSGELEVAVFLHLVDDYSNMTMVTMNARLFL